MAFSQLYYTSCEHGLSGFSGYQFNAVSDGVSAETMREVEALTGYEPPRSMLYSDAPADLARCPVNLCHLPGETTLIACVRYLGRDPSQRFGNYFAHALASRAPETDSGRLLPIELWRSPVWAAATASGTRLPALERPPPAGPLTPATVEGFLRGHPHRERLPELLAAVIRALEADRTVLLVDATSDRVAHWFAAVSYLLPPPLARALSFATYLAKPERSRLRLVGTVPEAGVPTGPDLQDGFDVFDFVGGAFPPAGAGPLPRLLVRVGPAASGPFWSWAADYTKGTERSAADWYLPAVAAAATGSVPLTEEDLAAIIPWLAEADHLGGPALAEVTRQIYRLGPFPDDRLTALRTAALAGGDHELTEYLQSDLLDSELRRHLADDPDRSPAVPFKDPARAEAAIERVAALLVGADHGEATRLLLWAGQARLRLPQQVLRGGCRRIADGLLGALTTRPAAPELVAQLRQLAIEQPEFRTQLRRALAALADPEHPEGPEDPEAPEERDVPDDPARLRARPRSPEYFVQLFDALPGGLLYEADLAEHPTLLAAELTAQAVRQPEARLDLLPRVLAATGEPALTGALLRRLWPNGQLTHRQARDVLRRLPPGLGADRAAGAWFGAAVRRRPEDPAALADCLRLCQLLVETDRLAWLAEDDRGCLDKLLELRRLLVETDRPVPSGVLVELLRRPLPPTWGSARLLLGHRLPAAMARCEATPDDIPWLLSRLEHRAQEVYLRQVAEELPRQPPHLARAHAEGLVAAAEVLDEWRRLRVHEALAPLVERWPAEEIERFARQVGPRSPSYAARLAARAEERRRGRVRRLTRRIPWRRKGGDR